MPARYPDLDAARAACSWMRSNRDDLMDRWLGGVRPTNNIVLGGIVSITGNSYQDEGVVPGETQWRRKTFEIGRGVASTSPACTVERRRRCWRNGECRRES